MHGIFQNKEKNKIFRILLVQLIIFFRSQRIFKEFYSKKPEDLLVALEDNKLAHINRITFSAQQIIRLTQKVNVYMTVAGFFFIIMDNILMA